ncbi:MAG TPA: hypothetical protein VKR30_05970 [Candidatus Limnocylindrales bacterium]|nr:hypothetical protein [Candidatus Limnocylindrales bacterium]
MRGWHGTGLALALLVGLTGLVFVAQGLGAPIGHSFMIGDLRWTAIGAVMLVLALAWSRRALRRSR